LGDLVSKGPYDHLGPDIECETTHGELHLQRRPYGVEERRPSVKVQIRGEYIVCDDVETPDGMGHLIGGDDLDVGGEEEGDFRDAPNPHLDELSRVAGEDETGEVGPAPQLD